MDSMMLLLTLFACAALVIASPREKRQPDQTAGAGPTTTDASTTTTTDASTTTIVAYDLDHYTYDDLPAGIVMVSLPEGTFTMGLESSTMVDQTPNHQVTLSAFQMSEAEITNQQYVDFLNEAYAKGLVKVAKDTGVTSMLPSPDMYVVGSDASDIAGKKLINLSGTRVMKDHNGDNATDPEHPLNLCWIAFDEDADEKFYLKDPQDSETMKWESICDDALDYGLVNDYEDWDELKEEKLPSKDDISQWPATFIQWYGAKAFADYYDVSLPTEAQYEYAGKATYDLPYATDDGTIDETKANYNVNGIGTLATGHVFKVKSYKPNPFGLYDLSGNVWEWCEDFYNDYASADQTDPQCTIGSPNGFASDQDDTTCVGMPGGGYTCDTRIRRGSSWNYHDATQATTYREKDLEWRGNDHFGFRIVMN